MNRRFPWDEYFMLLAKIAALRSGCNSRPTGAVIVRDKRVIATGYNGTIKGQKQCTDNGDGFCLRRSIGSDDKGENKYKDCPSIHAEANALDQLIINGPNIGTNTYSNELSIYTTLFPCKLCIKRLASVGIKKVFYEIEYRSDDPARDKSWEDFADELGVKTYPQTIQHENFPWIKNNIFNLTSERKLV